VSDRLGCVELAVQGEREGEERGGEEEGWGRVGEKDEYKEGGRTGKSWRRE
jgi:hypothetical protein